VVLRVGIFFKKQETSNSKAVSIIGRIALIAMLVLLGIFIFTGFDWFYMNLLLWVIGVNWFVSGVDLYFQGADKKDYLIEIILSLVVFLNLWSSGSM